MSNAHVPSITGAPESLAEDQARRTRRYLVQMGARIVFLLAAIFLAEGWVRWVLIACAVVLPYSAVLFANAGRDRVTYDTSPMTRQSPAELPAEPSTTPADDGTSPGGNRIIEQVEEQAEHGSGHESQDAGPDAGQPDSRDDGPRDTTEDDR